jgi:hypothetical protein
MSLRSCAGLRHLHRNAGRLHLGGNPLAGGNVIGHSDVAGESAYSIYAADSESQRSLVSSEPFQCQDNR